MTTIPSMIRTRVDRILGLAANGLRFYVAQSRRALSDGQGSEGQVTNVSRQGYCFVAPVGCATSPYIQQLYAQGDLSCKRINSYSGWREV
jgi:DNA-binding winged helix-turn-helix (wHTH) protein